MSYVELLSLDVFIYDRLVVVTRLYVAFYAHHPVPLSSVIVRTVCGDVLTR